MKSKMNAKERRTEESQRRKERWSKVGEIIPAEPAPKIHTEHASAEERVRRQEEETREFLAYLSKDIVVAKEEPETIRRKATRKRQMGVINLEAGMPPVEEAVSRMKIGLQEMRVSGTKLVRLIHGYGSTGRGGKICIRVRTELERMKNRSRIQGYVTGENFGPYNEESRKLTDRFPEIVRDRDYGRCNHGITIVIL